MTDSDNGGRFGPVRDGFEEQKILLTRISRELDEYFTLRTLGSIRM